MSSRSRNLDKFYTTEETVKICYSQIDLSFYDLIVEPSAGNGSFLNPIANDYNYLAYDIEPEDSRITREDFLLLSDSRFSKYRRILTIGNPPFGVSSSLALKFIKKAMVYSQTVAFILPRSFKKPSLQNKVPLEFTLTKCIDLPENSFTLDDKNYDAPCVFQVWERNEGDRNREKLVSRLTSNLFTFGTAEVSDISIRRVGVNAGHTSEDLSKSKSSHYFLRMNDEIRAKYNLKEVVELCNGIVWKDNNTIGPKSISKGEVIDALEDVLE